MDTEVIVLVVANVLSAVVIIATLKADVRWLRSWCSEHKNDDERNFRRQEEDMRELHRRIDAARMEG